MAGKICSDRVVRIRFEDGRTMLLDRDAKLMVLRGGDRLTLYADQLRTEDDILFDNRDLLFNLPNCRR